MTLLMTFCDDAIIPTLVRLWSTSQNEAVLSKNSESAQPSFLFEGIIFRFVSFSLIAYFEAIFTIKLWCLKVKRLPVRYCI